MKKHCPRCGAYTDSKATFCGGCGGNLAVLWERFPAIDSLEAFIQGGGTVGRGAVAPIEAPEASIDALDLGAPAPAGGASDLDASLGSSFDAGLAADLSTDLSGDLSGALSSDFSGDLSGGLGAPGDMGNVDFSGLGTDIAVPAGTESSSGELDFSALDPSSPPPLPDPAAAVSSPGIFDLDAGMDMSASASDSLSDDGGLDFGSLASPADSSDDDTGSLPTLSFDPAAATGGLDDLGASPLGIATQGASEVYDLDAQLGSGSGPAIGGSGEIDFSALSGDVPSASDSGNVDFSNLSTLDQSSSSDTGGDVLDLSLSNFGGGMGELDFSSLVQDASGPATGEGDAIDFSGLSSIDVAPPAGAASGSGSGDRPADDIVYDLDLDAASSPGTADGPVADGFGFDASDMSGMEDDLLKASIISYKPSGQE